MKHAKRSQQEKGISLLLGTLAVVAIVPLVGLVVDVGFLYGIRTQMQASVDGAALAGARAMVLDTSTTSTTNTVNNAATWFYANFPSGTWGTSGTAMDKNSNIQVWEDCAPPPPAVATTGCSLNLWHVDVAASTQAPTYFMKFFGAGTPTINVIGKATRRNVAAMMVLDRSGSMCRSASGAGSQPCGASQVNSACAAMISAAKVFVGQFANGRDYIGMVTFNSGVWVTQPVQDFRSVLGYTDALGNSNSTNLAIDHIQCDGGTGTTAAMSVAYNELKKLNQGGALNVILLETDGLPNTLAMNWWDNSGTKTGISSNSGCTDINGNSRPTLSTAWNTAAKQRNWFDTTSYTGTSYSTVYGTGTYYNAPTGPYGSFYTSDPYQGQYYLDLFVPWATSDSANPNTLNGTANGCGFNSSSGITPGSAMDVAWFPKTDIFGNQLNPPTCSQGATGPCAYNNSTYGAPATVTGGYIDVTGQGSTAANWSSAKSAVLNAVDNAAYNIRSDATLKPVIYSIGLAGNYGNPPDTTLLQRVANDPFGDVFNATPQYYSCNDTVHNPQCITFAGQQQGRFVYSSNSGSLRQAFLTLSGQMLRLSQ